MTDLGVRVIRAYAQFSVGHIFFPPGLLREDLVRRGFVEIVKAEPVSEPRKPGRRPS